MDDEDVGKLYHQFLLATDSRQGGYIVDIDEIQAHGTCRALHYNE